MKKLNIVNDGLGFSLEKVLSIWPVVLPGNSHGWRDFSKDWAGSARCLGNACQGPDFTLTAHFSWEQTYNSLMLCAETLPTTSRFLSLWKAEESTLPGPGTALGSGRAALSSECLMPPWSPHLVRAKAVWMRGLEHSSPSTALINSELGCSWKFFSWSLEGWKSRVKVLKSPWVSKPPGFPCVFSFGVCLYRAAFPAPVCFWVFAVCSCSPLRSLCLPVISDWGAALLHE